MLLKGRTPGKKNRRHHGKNSKATAGSNAAVNPSAVIRNTVATGTTRNHSATRRVSHQQRPQQQQLVNYGTPDEHGNVSSQEPCDSSNDSGLGFEERHQQQLATANAWNGAGEEDSKRRRMDIKLESEDANFAFPEVVHGASPDSKAAVASAARVTANGIGIGAIGRTGATGSGNSVGRVVGVTRPRPAIGVLSKRSLTPNQGPVTLTSQLSNATADGKVQLQIICQPEQQHRARYQTEGSRGAVKDRTGNGFPIVRLIGYDKPTTLQVFIGTDLGRVAPHMFYQACRVSGKNSTPCVERKLDGTIVIEVDMDPAKDMMVTCDCVGILKERNVDVEHRFPQEAGILQGRSKKKSTRCRMVFRTSITHPDGTTEMLQACSQPIVCTQPPGIPEICKKSLTSCPCTGGLELFILGKNFLKDTRIVFQLDNDDITSMEPHWECAVLPDKEFLQQTHLVCVVPPYRRQDLAPSETINIKLYAVSSGKTSEPHTFLYTSASSPPEPSVGKVESITPPLNSSTNDTSLTAPVTAVPLATGVPSNTLISQAVAGTSSFLAGLPSQQPPQGTENLKSDPSSPPTAVNNQVTPVMMWAASQTTGCQNSPSDVMMPPPSLVANPLMNRRSSSNLQLILPDNLKTEVLDENSESSMISENSLPGMTTPTTNGPSGTSPLQQLVNENSRDSPQANLIRSVAVPTNGASSQDAVNLLGVVDLIRNQHPLTLATAHQNAFGNMHEPSQVKVLSPHHINKEASGMLPTDQCPNGSIPGTGVVDLRMKHHQSEFNALTSFGTSSSAPLTAQSAHSVEKYLNHIETGGSVVKEPEPQDNGFVGAMQQRNSIITNGRQPSPSSMIDTAAQAAAKIDALVNSAAESHQIVSPMQNVNANTNAMMTHVSSVSDHVADGITSSQTTRTSPPIPVKAMLLEALLPTQSMQPMTSAVSTAVSSPVSVNSEPVVVSPPANDGLLTSINNALMPALTETVINSAVSPNANVNVSPLQVGAEPMQTSERMQIQHLTQQDVVMQQQVQQVEQVVAHAQQQVEQVVAHAQQQAVQAVQQAQQQVVHQVVQHAQVVQQAVQQCKQVQAAPAVQQAVQQATQEVVQQAVQQATHEVVQQVQAVQQAVQQAQAAQAMQHAVQQDIGSMLNQPAGFVAEASSALASGAAQEPNQQRLTTAAEQAINNVITNATQDIINNRPISTTTAHAIIATKNILNSVATQSAQLMNNAMETILPKSPSAQNNMVEQVTSKSPPVQMPVVQNRQTVNVPMPTAAPNSNETTVRKPEDAGGMLPQELTSMSEHDLISYINPSCFDPQGGFLM